LSTGRLIAIGDIHGCAAEFAELLDKLALRRGDRLVLLGDLINRGPDSRLVIDLARAARARCLLGNHELRLLRSRCERDDSLLRAEDRATIAALRPADWEFLAAMPSPTSRRISTPSSARRLPPGSPGSASMPTSSRASNHRCRRPTRKRADAPGSPVWAERWAGPPFVVYGHTPRPTVHKLKWSLCIDSACVFGGSLTAYILPERRLVQVKAKRRYWSNP
jgi:hypothetical protein